MKNQQNIHITTITSVQLFDTQKPRYNSYQIGTGAWTNKKKYTRKQKHRYSTEG